MDRFGVPYWATLPVAAAVCFVFGLLIGFPALRLAGHYLALATFALALAIPQLLKYRLIEDWTGGVQGIVLSKPEAPFEFALFGQPLSPDRWLFFFTLAVTIADVRARVQPAARPRRPGADRDPRPSDRRRGDGHQPAGLQVAHLRRVGGVHRRGRRARRGSSSPSWRPTASPCSCRSPSWSAWSSAGWRRSRRRSSARIFIQFVPNIADEISKSAPWAIYGVFLIVFMYLMPTGVMGLLKKVWAKLAPAREPSRQSQVNAELRSAVNVPMPTRRR